MFYLCESFSTYNICLEAWCLRTLWRAGAGAVLLLLEGLREAEPGVVAAHQGVFDEENLQDVPGNRAAEEWELKTNRFSHFC